MIFLCHLRITCIYRYSCIFSISPCWTSMEREFALPCTYLTVWFGMKWNLCLTDVKTHTHRVSRFISQTPRTHTVYQLVKPFFCLCLVGICIFGCAKRKTRRNCIFSSCLLDGYLLKLSRFIEGKYLLPVSRFCKLHTLALVVLC